MLAEDSHQTVKRNSIIFGPCVAQIIGSNDERKLHGCLDM